MADTLGPTVRPSPITARTSIAASPLRNADDLILNLKDDPAFMPVVRTALMLRVASVLGIVPPDGGVLCSWRSVSERRLGVFVTVGEQRGQRFLEDAGDLLRWINL